MYNAHEACAEGIQQAPLSAVEAQGLQDVRGPRLDEDGFFAHFVGSASARWYIGQLIYLELGRGERGLLCLHVRFLQCRSERVLTESSAIRILKGARRRDMIFRTKGGTRPSFSNCNNALRVSVIITTGSALCSSRRC